MSDIYGYTVKNINGDDVSLDDYRDQALLVVNTASKCGFTPQYKGLETLYQEYKERGFSVLGFPCNQFANQEPENEEGIATFCERNFGVSFPLFAKIDVNGANASPLYQHLKSGAKGILGTEAIKWNFTKFLVDREGRVVKRFGPRDTPEKIEKDLQSVL